MNLLHGYKICIAHDSNKFRDIFVRFIDLSVAFHGAGVTDIPFHIRVKSLKRHGRVCSLADVAECVVCISVNPNFD